MNQQTWGVEKSLIYLVLATALKLPSNPNFYSPLLCLHQRFSSSFFVPNIGYNCVSIANDWHLLATNFQVFLNHWKTLSKVEFLCAYYLSDSLHQKIRTQPNTMNPIWKCELFCPIITGRVNMWTIQLNKWKYNPRNSKFVPSRWK